MLVMCFSRDDVDVEVLVPVFADDHSLVTSTPRRQTTCRVLQTVSE